MIFSFSFFFSIQGIFNVSNVNQYLNMKFVGHKFKFWKTKTMQIVHILADIFIIPSIMALFDQYGLVNQDGNRSGLV